jgi:hypothetical protein
MARRVARSNKKEDASAIIQHLHKLVTCGPWDLDIAAAMALYGYDEVKWAEGQVVLAELISSDRPVEGVLAVAAQWYTEAARTARCALITRPGLLDKLGVMEAVLE